MQISRFTNLRRIWQVTSVSVLALIVSAVGYVGVRNNHSSSALTPGKAALIMTPASGNFTVGSTVPVTIKVTSTVNISTVQAYITYPASQLQLVSIDNSPIFPTLMRENKTNGTIDIVRGIAGGGSGVSGENIVVTAQFKVIGTSGSASLVFGTSSAAYDTSGSGINLLEPTSSQAATYTIGATDGIPLYRLANWKTKERLFTTSWPEVVAAQQNNSGWVYENIAMNVHTTAGASRTAVYRMANWKTKERLFTTDYNETQYALSHYPGWVFEGTAFYASTNTANTVVYRMANFITHERLFTTDQRERDAIRDKNGWVYEGVAFYAAP